MSIPKRQHYVSQTYLEYWLAAREAKAGEKSMGVRTFNKVRNQAMFATDLNSISQVRYFNRLDVDQDVYDMLAYKYSEQAGVAALVVKEFQILIGIDEYKKRGEPHADQLDDINKRFLEDKFTVLESRFSKTLNLISADVGLYIKSLVERQNDIRDLLGIFAVQLFRTKHARDVVTSEVKKLVIVREDGEKQLSEQQAGNVLKSILFIDSLLFGERLGAGDYSVELLVAQGQEKFITSSSPAIILSKSDEGQKDLSDFEGFMPLTPSVALVVRGRRPLGRNLMFRGVSKGEVSIFNKKTYDASSYDVYASYDYNGLFGY